MEEFEKVRPLILGALLEGLSEGLRSYDSVELDRLPRMADFCKWAVACEGAYWPAGAFMAAYDEAHARSSPSSGFTGARSLSEKQCSKRYTSLVECKDANYSTTKSRLL